MSAYLAYSYSCNLTQKEQIEIDNKTEKSRQEFSRGFVKGVGFSLVAYSLYSLATSAAYAEEANVPSTTPKIPGDTGAVQPKSTPNTNIHKPKPGFKPLSDGTKGAFVGGGGSVCGAALESGDFFLGLAFAFLLVIAGVVMNRE